MKYERSVTDEMGKKIVADRKDALKSVTAIMRDDENKTAEKMKAAEMIIKYGGEASDDNGAAAGVSNVMIVDDIPKELPD